MRTAVICLLLLLVAGVAFAAERHGLPPLRVHVRTIVGVISFGALGAMLFWSLRK